MSEDTENIVKKREFSWMTVLYYIHIHVLGFYGFWLLFAAKWATIIFTFALTMIGILGLTAGAHRLWAHNSYKANVWARFLFMIAQTSTGTGSIRDWVMDHRIHHEYYGTDKDTHNHDKGFWYSHVVSNILTRHPDYDKIEKTIDKRDLESDSLVWVQHKLYLLLFVIFGLLLPVNTPAEYWGEDLSISIFVLGFFRLAITINASMFINSGQLIWGLKDTDKFPPDDNYIFYINRNFWLRYHYFVPWDHKTGEFGTYDTGFTSIVIKLLYELGLVSELKTNTTEELQEALYNHAMKRFTEKEMLSELQTKAACEALKHNYEFRH